MEGRSVSLIVMFDTTQRLLSVIPPAHVCVYSPHYTPIKPSLGTSSLHSTHTPSLPSFTPSHHPSLPPRHASLPPHHPSSHLTTPHSTPTPHSNLTTPHSHLTTPHSPSLPLTTPHSPSPPLTPTSPPLTPPHPNVRLGGDLLSAVQVHHLRRAVGQGGEPLYLILALLVAHLLRLHLTHVAAAVVTQHKDSLLEADDVLDLDRGGEGRGREGEGR